MSKSSVREQSRFVFVELRREDRRVRCNVDEGDRGRHGTRRGIKLASCHPYLIPRLQGLRARAHEAGNSGVLGVVSFQQRQNQLCTTTMTTPRCRHLLNAINAQLATLGLECAWDGARTYEDSLSQAEPYREGRVDGALQRQFIGTGTPTAPSQSEPNTSSLLVAALSLTHVVFSITATTPPCHLSSGLHNAAHLDLHAPPDTLRTVQHGARTGHLPLSALSDSRSRPMQGPPSPSIPASCRVTVPYCLSA